jgi:hypothetical protein
VPLNEYCECGPGLDGNVTNEGCLIKEFVAQFHLFIKNTFEDNPGVEGLDPTVKDEYYYDFEGFTGDLSSTVEENLQISNQTEQSFKEQEFRGILKDRLKPVLGEDSPFKEKWTEYEIKDCTLENNYYICLITVYLKGPVAPEGDDLSSVLTDLCIDSTDEGKECFFMSDLKEEPYYYSTRDTDPLFSLVLDKQKLNSADTRLDIYSVCPIKLIPVLIFNKII